MIFLIVLLAALAIAWLIPAHGRRRSVRDAVRVAMAIAFVFAGASHFLTPTPFVQHLPTWVPERHAVIYLTGLVEVALGVALLRATRWRAEVAALIALYLLAVFPANVYVAVRDVAVDGQPGGWYPWARLPFQALFIWWVLWSAEALPRRRGVERGGMTPVPAGR
jgi:uncharacterized membrane protein